MSTKSEIQSALCAEIMTPEQLRESREYHRLGLYCTLISKVWSLILAVFIAFFLARPLAEWLCSQCPFLAVHTYALLVVFLIAVMIFEALLGFPLDVYDDWILEQKFGLSNLTLGHWFRRYLLHFALGAGLNLVVVGGIFFLIRLCGPWWWAAVSVMFLFFSVVLGILFPVLVLPLFYKVERLEKPSLMERFEEITRPTTLKLTGIYRLDLSIETSKANAMLGGLGSTRRVLLGDTLLENFTEDEITAVFAHEVGHHVHRHILKQCVMIFLGSFAAFWLTDLALKLWLGPEMVYAEFPVWAVPFLSLILSLISFVAEPFGNMFSRRNERQADAYALKTASPEAMRSAFVKLAVQNKADPFPHPLEVFWLHSHPAIGERILNCGE
ncbi:MAG: M48 family metallopeptidase [Thermoguttaceae bacterium]|nr:M48 family metallopeptidase [Thermoguttaceae bacterium]